MAQTKIKKEIVSSKYTDLLTGKLKEFKTWAQVKSPKTLRPALSYALDWLAPELLGTGFRLYEVSDTEMKATVPCNKTNLDSQLEIHQGLVVNAVFEMAKTYIHRQMPDHFFHFTGSDLSLVKKSKWNSDLHLLLSVNPSQLDDFFMLLQKNRSAIFEVDVRIGKSDSAQLKLQIAATNLIA